MIDANILEHKYLLSDSSATKQMENVLQKPNRARRDYGMRFESQQSGNDLKLLVFRDSFCTELIRYLSQTFGKSVFLWSSKMNKKIIEAEKPDIVI
jgi:hypothetical protein